MVQQHRIYILQFRKGDQEPELSSKGGHGRRIMYYYQENGNGGGRGAVHGGSGGAKNGKNLQAKPLSRRRVFAVLALSLLSLASLLAGAATFFPSAAFLSSIQRGGGGGHSVALARAVSRAPAPCSGMGNGSICCDRASVRADVCFARGDVRMHSPSGSFVLFGASGNTSVQGERVRPYTRKWEESVMATIDVVRLRRAAPGDAAAMARCDVRHEVPAVVFSTGGYTGNVYHEFNDGILPLFVTAQHLRRRVVFVILEYHSWWMTKYGDVLARLSDYPPIDFAADRRVHCFPEVTAGLRIHGELTVDPAKMPGAETIRDFRRLLDDAYRDRIRYLQLTAPPDTRPKLVIMSRTGSRLIENEAAVVAMAEKVGFRVRVLRPDRTTELCKLYWELNSSDAMVGVHGAAMTHFLFMRPGKAFIQVVPLGTDWAAATYYGEPASRLGLRYTAYKILPEESSLWREYPRGHPVLTDPASVGRQGWIVTKKVYLDRQNVRLNLTRFRKRLVRVHQYLVADSARKRRPRSAG